MFTPSSIIVLAANSSFDRAIVTTSLPASNILHLSRSVLINTGSRPTRFPACTCYRGTLRKNVSRLNPRSDSSSAEQRFQPKSRTPLSAQASDDLRERYRWLASTRKTLVQTVEDLRPKMDSLIRDDLIAISNQSVDTICLATELNSSILLRRAASGGFLWKNS